MWEHIWLTSLLFYLIYKIIKIQWSLKTNKNSLRKFIPSPKNSKNRRTFPFFSLRVYPFSTQTKSRKLKDPNRTKNDSLRIGPKENKFIRTQKRHNFHKILFVKMRENKNYDRANVNENGARIGSKRLEWIVFLNDV